MKRKKEQQSWGIQESFVTKGIVKLHVHWKVQIKTLWYPLILDISSGGYRGEGKKWIELNLTVKAIFKFNCRVSSWVKTWEESAYIKTHWDGQYVFISVWRVFRDKPNKMYSMMQFMDDPLSFFLTMFLSDSSDFWSKRKKVMKGF